MDKLQQKNTDSVGTQLQGMNSTTVKMKEEEDDRYKQFGERITNMEKKIFDMDEKYEDRSDEPRGANGDQNQDKAVITGFHSETSESEVVQLLKETITDIGMTIENASIECAAKPITHAFNHFKSDDERFKCIRSANMLKNESRGGYVKYCIHVKHNILLDLINTNWTLKHVKVKGQIVVKTCQSGNLKYIKYQDIETEVEGQMEKLAIKKLIATTVSSRERGQKRRDEGRTTSSQMQTATQENQRSDRSTSEGGGRDKLKKVDGDFPPSMRLKKKRETTTMTTQEKRRLERKRRRTTQTLQCRWRCATVSEKNGRKKQRRQQQQ